MEWISVKDRLPHGNEPKLSYEGTLVFMPNHPDAKVKVTYEHSSWWAENEGRPDEITHWMPLPPPPALDEREGQS